MCSSTLDRDRPSRLPRYRWLRFALVALALAGCQGSRWTRRVIFPSKSSTLLADGLVLYLEHKESEGRVMPQRFNHPIQVEPDRMAEILGKLVYRKGSMFGDPEVHYVFTRGEIAPMGQAISHGLAALRENERLRFLVPHKAGVRGVLFGETATSGVMFRPEDGQLHIAFDRLHDGFSGPEDGDPSYVSFPVEPTEPRSPSAVIVPFEGSRLKKDDVTKRPLPHWLVVDIDAGEVAAAPAAPKTSPEPSTPAAPSRTTGGKEKETPEKPVREPRKPATSVTPPPRLPAPVETAYRELAAQLRKLAALHSTQALSEKEYVDAVNGVLDKALPLPRKQELTNEQRLPRINQRLLILKRLRKEKLLTEARYQAEYTRTMAEL